MTEASCRYSRCTRRAVVGEAVCSVAGLTDQARCTLGEAVLWWGGACSDGPCRYSDTPQERCCGESGVRDGACRYSGHQMHTGRRAVVGRPHAVMRPDGVRASNWRCSPQLSGEEILEENVKGEESQPGLLKEE